ncbi:unnamed protein product [Phytomonas sp. Hart1]|nr:unnamed protein product [Phytomonas sp. Hart1]|eukprot:CCW66202.1 unnamed protein product [Phytomonas sp. isolate Hart1]
MHDQPRIKQKESDEARKAREDDERKKGELYQALMVDYHAKKYTVDALQKNRKLLLEIPEAYTFYNYEREILEHLFKNASEEKGENVSGVGENKGPLEWLREDFKLNSAILQKDYKIYAAFVHRHWIFDCLASFAAKEEAPTSNKENASSTRAEDKGGLPYLTFTVKAIEKEMEECEKLLLLDERNFHAWNHRRWVFSIRQRPHRILFSPLKVDSSSDGEESSLELFSSSEAAEIDYTKAMICRNFSNYSAWHERAVTLQVALCRHDRSGLLSPPIFSSAMANNGDRNGSSALPRRPSWLPLSTPSGDQAKPASSASSRGLSRHLLVHLVQELDLLLQAIYCDPNDQAVWFYTPFVREVFELYEPFLHDAFLEVHAELVNYPNLNSSAAWGLLRTCRGDFLDVLVRVAIDILIEEKSLGEDTCFLPYHFLLSNFARLLKKAQSEKKELPIAARASSLKLRSYITQTLKRIFNNNDEVDDGKNDSNNDYYFTQNNEKDGEELDIEVSWCFERLHELLVRVDPLRKGMYDDLLSVASIWKTNTE